MTIAGGMAVYFVIWWIVLFVVLPFGVRSQVETGDIVEGTEPGAPILPGLARKAAITTIIAAMVFAIVWYVWTTFEL
jgi:predicted secreted protein